MLIFQRPATPDAMLALQFRDWHVPDIWSRVTRRKQRNHSPEFKAKGAIATVKGDRTLAELAPQFDVHPNQITDWKTQLLAHSSVVFGERPAKESGADIPTLQARIGQLALDNNLMEKACTKAGMLSAS